MKIVKSILFVLGLASCCAVAQPHMHGKAELFIAQDDEKWQLQFTLPAADVFGFEHRPMSQKQRAQVVAQKAILKNVTKLVNIPSNCKIETQDIEVPEMINEHHHEQKHAHGHGNQNNHSKHTDVEVTILLTCDAVISELSLTVFSSFPSLQLLNVIWALTTEQGQSEASPSKSTVRFKL